jgi:hypothetical protein
MPSNLATTIMYFPGKVKTIFLNSYRFQGDRK